MKLKHAAALTCAGILALSLAGTATSASAEEAAEKNLSHKTVKFMLAKDIKRNPAKGKVILGLKFPKSKAQSAAVVNYTKNGRNGKKWAGTGYIGVGSNQSLQLPAMKSKKPRSNGLVGLWQVQVEVQNETASGTSTQVHNYRFKVELTNYDDDWTYLEIKKWK